VDLPTKSIAVNKIEYQLGRVSARDGSWLVGQFLPHMTGAWMGEGEVTEKDLGLALAAALRGFSEDVFQSIQSKALSVVKRLDDKGTPMPVAMANGSLVQPLSLVDLTALLVASLAFNLHCFFEPGAAETLRAVFPDLGPLSAPGSTATS
jgi:hypothetical protein